MQQLTLNNTKSIHNKNWKLIEPRFVVSQSNRAKCR